MRLFKGLLPVITLCLLAAPALARDAAQTLARAKALSGLAAWDSARSWKGEGMLATGGLSGELHQSVDLLTGRSVARYRLGPVEGASGYDGRLSWEQDGGGEVVTQDSPADIRRAHSQAWLDACGYWSLKRMPAVLGAVTEQIEQGRRYDVITATPRDGDPVVLWFDGATGLLARVIQKQGADTATTLMDDYRAVGGVKLAFHVVTDLTDAAGRTDPNRRVDVRLTHAELNVRLDAAQFAVPEMPASAAIDDPQGLTTIAFDLVNNHLYVDGHVDDKPVRFMVDTGGVNLLTPAAARRLGLSVQGQMSAQGSGEQRQDVGLARAREVRVGAARLARPVFYIIDLGRLWEVEGVQADGLIGYEMFRRFGVLLDYAHQRLVLSTPDKFVPPAGAHELPFTFNEHTPVVQGSLDGMAIRMSVDTGSRTSLTLNSPFVRDHQLVSRYHASPQSVLGWGVGGAFRARAARLGMLRLGGFDVGGIAGELFTGDKGSFADPDIDGNLGGAVLRRFTVGFDYSSRKMYLAPAGDLAAPDAFDRSGLFLLATDEGIEVADVAADSAAAHAGFQAGDRLVSIGGMAAAQRTLGQWRQLLRESPPGTTLAVEVRGAQTARHVQLTLADRIPPTPVP
jgi:predicted aspartyl protease